MVFSARAATKDTARHWRRRAWTRPRFSSTLPTDFWERDHVTVRPVGAAPVYTDDKVKLARALDRDVSHRSALERTPGQGSRQSEGREASRSESVTRWPSVHHETTVLSGVKTLATLCLP